MAEIIDALGRLIDVIVKHFGPTGSVLIVLGAVTISALYRWYEDRRRNRAHNALIKEHDRTVQRMAARDRENRRVIYKQVYGWSDDEIERLIERNEYLDPMEAKRIEGGW